MMPGTVCSKAQRSTAQHRTTGQGTARRGTERRRAALLSYSWAEPSWECILVIQQ